MKHFKTRKTMLIAVLCLAITLAFAAIAFAGIATSPLGVKPLAGLGSCPLGTVTQILPR